MKNAALLGVVAVLMLAGCNGTATEPGGDEGRARGADLSDRTLTYSPPELSDPETVAYPERGSLTLDDERDYIVTLPNDGPLRNDGGLVITGGRNVVVIGGTVDVGQGADGDRRGAYFKDQTGTMYVEGVRLTSSSTDLTEGINLSQSDGATVVIQNVHIDLVVGEWDGQHADGLQTWAGPAEILIDGMDITTGYQGIMLTPNRECDDCQMERAELRNIGIVGTADAGYLIWRTGDWPLTTDNVQLSTEGLTKDGSAYKSGSRNYGTGLVYPEEVDSFANTAGYDYESPGYLD